MSLVTGSTKKSKFFVVFSEDSSGQVLDILEDAEVQYIIDGDDVRVFVKENEETDNEWVDLAPGVYVVILGRGDAVVLPEDDALER